MKDEEQIYMAERITTYPARLGAESRAPATPTRLPKTFASLRHRNFQLYFAGQLISVAGTWMQIVAQAWLVYELTHSELMLGVLGFAAGVPALLLSPWAGVVVDQAPKRKLLVITQSISMIQAFLLAALVFTGTVQVWNVVALAALLGLVNAFDAPARQAFVIEMVSREELPNAIALNSLMFNGARVVGPAVGGALLLTLGAGWCFLVNGLTFLAVIAGLLLMRLKPFMRRRQVVSPLQNLRAGLQYVGQRRDMLALLVLSAMFSLFGVSFATLLPAFSDQVLGAGASGYGALQVASGIGAIVSAVWLASQSGPGRRGRVLSLASCGFPVIVAVLAFSRSLPVALVLLAVSGLASMIQYVLINTLLQTLVADEMRGRVMSLYTLTIFGLTPFGNLAIGALGQVYGLTMAIWLSAAIAGVCAVGIQLWAPEVRRLS